MYCEMPFMHHEAAGTVEAIDRPHFELNAFAHHVIPTLIDGEIVQRVSLKNAGFADADAQKPCAAPEKYRR